MLGLRSSDLEFINKQFINYPNISKASIFGSRAKGTYKHNSDIDIVVYGDNIDQRMIFKLHELLEENAPYPFYVDIVSYKLADDILKKEIDSSQVVIYRNN